MTTERWFAAPIVRRQKQENLDIFAKLFTSAYNYQAHRSTNVSQFSLSLTQRTHDTLRTDISTVLPRDALTPKTPMALRVRLLVQMATKAPKVFGNVGQNQRQYKNILSQKIERMRYISVEQLVYVDRPPLVILAIHAMLKI